MQRTYILPPCSFKVSTGGIQIFSEINTGFSVPFIQMAVVSEFSALPYFYFFFPRSHLELGFVTITNSCPSPALV